MKHEISVLGCGVIYIDNERVFGSKPYGLFSTVNWSATDEDLKRIADRCLELVADRKTEPQYDIDKGTIKCDNCSENGSYKCSKCDGEIYFKRLEVEDEPQKRTKENCKGCKYNEYPYDSGTCFVRVCINGNKYEPKDEPQTDCPWK